MTASAAGMDIIADELTRTADGIVVAKGSVIIEQRPFRMIEQLHIAGRQQPVASFALKLVRAGKTETDRRQLVFAQRHGQWLIIRDSRQTSAPDVTREETTHAWSAATIARLVETWRTSWNRHDKATFVALYDEQAFPAEYSQREQWLKALETQFAAAPERSLHADEVRYDPQHHRITASGHVRIRSRDGRIEASAVDIDSESQLGTIADATVFLPGGERLHARKARRISAHELEASDVSFTACPADDEAWTLKAEHALLNDEQGILQARDASFHWLGVTAAYLPWWRQAYKRQSGFLMPDVGSGRRRGTEVAVPYYFAPAENWDATLTPRWMSARGIMGTGEFRHVADNDRETITLEGIHDTLTTRTRSRIQGDIDWELPQDMRFNVRADHVSDHDYLADFGRDADVSRSFLSSQATLSQDFHYGDWSLLAVHQQDLSLQSDAKVAQILPRLESHFAYPAARWLNIHFDQQSTLFKRKIDTQGWRIDLVPYIEVPAEWFDGGINALFHAGFRSTQYRLTQTATRRLAHNSPNLSMEVRSTFEHISDDHQYRHAITPVLRYDWADAPDQTGDPNFDSAFGKLNWSNLLSGNRFSGRDRIEKANRITFMLENLLQQKDDISSRDLFRFGVGASYNFTRQRIDSKLQKAPIRPFSNLLAKLTWTPFSSLSLSGEAQFNPYERYMATDSIAVRWHDEHYMLGLAYRETDKRYAKAARLFDINASSDLTARWTLHGRWQYDTILKLTQQATVGLRYNHACWNIAVEGYRNNRRSGTTNSSDLGFHILLGFKGLGSVGS